MTLSRGEDNGTLHDLPPQATGCCHQHRYHRNQHRADKPLRGVSSRTKPTAVAGWIKRLYASGFDLNDETACRRWHQLGHDLAGMPDVGAFVCHSSCSLDAFKWQRRRKQQQQLQLEHCNQLQSHADDRWEVAVARASVEVQTLARDGPGSDSTQVSLSNGLKETHCCALSPRHIRHSTPTTTIRATAPLRSKSSSTGATGGWHTFAFALIVSLILFTTIFDSSTRLISAKSIESSPNNLATNDKSVKASDNHLLQEVAIETRSVPATTTSSPRATTKLDDLIHGISSIFTSTTTSSSATTATAAAATTTTTALPTRVTTLETTSELDSGDSTTELTSSASPALQEDDSASARDDDNDVEDCQGISSGESEEGTKLTDNERLVNLQACLQKKVKTKLSAMSRRSMALFDELSLSGGCASSLMTLMFGLGELKSYAFKFLDASAKIPSGVMYGLLSDFGDYDQCLSIRSNPNVQPADEAEEGTFSGKYCLLSIKLNYHVQLALNSSVPDGIYPDGVLWDELIRNYWTSKSTKGFQVGVCVPSRCNSDDIGQLYQLMAKNYNFQGEVMSCQDSNDRTRQQSADGLQLLIIHTTIVLVALSIVATVVDCYYGCLGPNSIKFLQQHEELIQFVLQILICFSIRRNWRLFLQKHDTSQCSVSGLIGQSPFVLTRSPLVAAGSCSEGGSQVVLLAPSSRPMPLRNCIDSIQSNLTQFTGVGSEHASGSSSVDAYNHRCSQLDSDAASLSTVQISMSASEIHGHQYQQFRVPASSCLPPSSANGANKLTDDYYCQLTVKISPLDVAGTSGDTASASDARTKENQQLGEKQLTSGGRGDILSHLSGLKLLVIVWITVGHSFLYPSANNYQYYRSIINMNITRDSVWFAATNFTLGIDMFLYMIGLIFVYKLAYSGNNYLKQHQQQRHRQAPTRVRGIFLPETTQTKAATQSVHLGNNKSSGQCYRDSAIYPNSIDIARLLFRKVLRFWPTYLAVISLAIVVPLVSDGPMWPEMVSHRLGDECRANWWANLLMVNNFFSATAICLPSSWFISVIMQCFLIGSIIAMLARKGSLSVAISILVLVLFGSMLASFAYAYQLGIRAPVIRMDETFVLEIDDAIYRLYTSIFNNLGPFLIGMLGGFMLVKWTIKNDKHQQSMNASHHLRQSGTSTTTIKRGGETAANKIDRLTKLICEFNVAFAISLLAILVLSSVFHQNYTRFWAAIYWSCHRVGWAIVTGYLVHQCATGKWKLLKDLLSLSSFIPLSNLIFIAYLVYPIFIHIHSGLVRDGLHVSIYNMMNIYIARLVMTFITALALHLLVELPFCSIEEILLNKWLQDKRQRNKIDVASRCADTDKTVVHPLLVVAPTVGLNQFHNKTDQVESIIGVQEHSEKAEEVAQTDRSDTSTKVGENSLNSASEGPCPTTEE